MADSLKPSDAAWDDLDQAFFASAPPDVAQPAPEPERFDDLFPGVPVEKQRELPVAVRRAAAAAATAGASVQRAIRGVTGRVGPAIAAAGRKSSGAFAAVGQGALRTARPVAARLAAALRSPRLNGQAIAIAFASVILITGLSAVIVAASRSSAHANLPATPLERRTGIVRATVAEAVTPAPLPYAPPAEAPAPEAQVSSTASEARSTPAQSTAAEPEIAPPAAAPSSETHQRRAEPARRLPVATPTPTPPAPAHKHRKAPSYSAERDLMVPSFVTQPAARPAPVAPAARPAPVAPAATARPAAPMFARPPAPANTPPPGPAPRPIFSR